MLGTTGVELNFGAAIFGIFDVKLKGDFVYY